MKGHFKMSVKEIDRIPIMQKLGKREIKVIKAANILNLSSRQIIRLSKRFRQEGISGLIHRSRGKQSARKVPEYEIERVTKIINNSYHDFGPTFALEKLKENHGVTFKRETLRKIMIERDLWKPKRKKPLKVFQIRVRREREGELVQADGSPHKWFEERGNSCTLLVFIDDATGKLKYLRLVKSETTVAYFKAVYSYIKMYGKPLAFYVDKHSVFKTTKIKEVTNEEKPTQFARSMRELGIELICANSPQAKGRVEKANKTLQDRLVKEFRLLGISNIKDGNDFLPTFIKEFNKKFAVIAVNQEDAHRPLLISEKLEDILVVQEVRHLSKNLTFQYKNILCQITEERPAYSLKYAPVELLIDWDGSLRVYYKGKKLLYNTVQKQLFTKVVNAKDLNNQVDTIVKRQTKTAWKPEANHPWRRFVYQVI